MEELKNRGKKIEERHRDTWDPFQLNPVGSEKESKRICFRIFQYLVAVIVGLAVLTSAIVAKGSLLVLSTLSSTKSKRSKKEKQFYMLMLVFCLVWPNFLVFIKSLWRCAFKSFVQPNFRTMSFVCAIECLVSLGTSILVLIVMPHFDVLTNLFITGGVCIISAILQIVYKLQTEKMKIIFPVCSLILTVAGYCLLWIDHYVRVSNLVVTSDCYMYIGIGMFSSLLISLCWWENPMQATTNTQLQETLTELNGFRDFVFVISSILRIVVIGAVYLIYYALIDESIVWSDFNLNDNGLLRAGLGLFLLQKFNRVVAHKIQEQRKNLTADISRAHRQGLKPRRRKICASNNITEFKHTAFCSAACHWFGVVACKIHAVRMSFAMPVCCTGPAVLLLGVIIFLTQAGQLDQTETRSVIELCYNLGDGEDKNIEYVILLELTRSICQTSLGSPYLQWPFSMLVLEGVCMWLGFVACTYYVWRIKVQRIERTSQLFVRRLYESAFIDLSLLLNTKMKVPKAHTSESQDSIQSCVIYLCATMWHETYDEMLKILTSMFRLDRYRGDPNKQHNDCFDFECHIYVDDAFMTEKNTGKRLVNSYVDDLTHVVIEVYRVFTNKEPDEVSIIDTPYGGRLMFVMPEGNMLYVHLKDKTLIRNKKRWSQIMYLYYLLGWKGYIVKNPKKISHQNNPRRDSLMSVDGEVFLLPQYENDHKRKLIADNNTYILALDGDTDFQPQAVILLVDRLRMYENVGAACGRIHPTGMGPMVWYQKFEYAVGHWLQKTAEHVFGSVLCSPGCFSLFRGSALMDDNVLKRYTTTATRASEYVQYDQGEDRWLCTLLLQQGWRVEYNAASDAYTNSPQEFKEFYNQRRRWGPSTLANTLDLLHSGGETVKRNASVSRLYILYQMFTVGSSMLGPASVTLMIAGAFQFIAKIPGTTSILIACVPPVFYILICFIAKPNNQIAIAGVMSVMYAFLMTASLFSIIGDMVMQKTFVTPTGLFLISMAIMYLVTAILHPQEFGNIIYGLMYFICIPSGYLLLTIYSLVNMHIVSWGTRESNKGEGEVKKNSNILCDRNCKLCCWDMKIQVTQETENLMIQQITGQAGQQAPPITTTAQDITPKANVTMHQDRTGTVTDEILNIVGAKKSDKPNQELAKGYDADFSDSDDNTAKLSASESSYNEIDDDDDDFDIYFDEIEDVPVRDWVLPVKEVFLKKLTYANMKRNLQEQIRYALRNKNEDDVCEELVLMLTDTLNTELSALGPEDILSESQIEELRSALEQQARHSLKSNHMEHLVKRVKRAIDKTLTAPQVQKLDEGEHDFWNKLIDRYLLPIVDTKAHLEEVTRELKSLRNKAVFLYFIVNLLWVVATFFLQAIGNDILSIEIPKHVLNRDGNVTEETLKVEPLSLMFLLSFAILLIVQFLAMLYHRVYTLIHVVSYRGTEKDYIQEEDDEAEGLALENHHAMDYTIPNDSL